MRELWRCSSHCNATVTSRTYYWGHLQLLGAWQQFQCLRGQSLLVGEGDNSEEQWNKEALTRNSLGCTSGREEGGGVVGTAEGRLAYTWYFTSTSEEHKSHWMNSATQLQVAYATETQMYVCVDSLKMYLQREFEAVQTETGGCPK